MNILALTGFFLPSLTLLGFRISNKKVVLIIPPLTLSICYIAFDLDLNLYKSEEGNVIHTIYFAFLLNIIFGCVENRVVKFSCLFIILIVNLLLIPMGLASIKYLI